MPGKLQSGAEELPSPSASILKIIWDKARQQHQGMSEVFAASCNRKILGKKLHNRICWKATEYKHVTIPSGVVTTERDPKISGASSIAQSLLDYGL